MLTWLFSCWRTLLLPSPPPPFYFYFLLLPDCSKLMDCCSVNTLKALPSGRSSVKTYWQMQWSPLYNTAQVEAPLIGGNCATYHSWINTVKTLPESTHLRGEFCPNLFTNKVNPSLEVGALMGKFCNTSAVKPSLEALPPGGKSCNTSAVKPSPEALPPGGKSCNTHWTHTVKLFLKTLLSDENSAIPCGQIRGAISERNSAIHF